MNQSDDSPHQNPPRTDEDAAERLEKAASLIQAKKEKLNLQYGLMKAAQMATKAPREETLEDKIKEKLPGGQTSELLTDLVGYLGRVDSLCECDNKGVIKHIQNWAENKLQVQTESTELGLGLGLGIGIGLGGLELGDDFGLVCGSHDPLLEATLEEHNKNNAAEAALDPNHLDCWNGIGCTSEAVTENIRGIGNDGELVFALPGDTTQFVRVDAPALHEYVTLVLLSDIGEILSWNESMKKVTGVEANSALGNDFSAFLLSEKDQEEFQDVLNGDAAKRRRIYGITKSDGVNIAYIEMQFVEASAGASNDKVILCIGRSRNKLEATLTYSTWVLEQIEAMLFCSTSSDNEDTRRLLNMIQQSRDIDPSDWGPLSTKLTFNKLVADYRDDLEGSGDRNIEITLNFDEKVPDEIHTDLLRFPNTVAYIVNNAVRCSPNGGQVCIGVYHDRHGDESMGTLRVTVTDEGNGIHENVLDAVRSMSADEDAPGRNLRNSRLVIQELGGDITFERGTATALKKRRQAATSIACGVPIREDTVGTTATIIIPWLPPTNQCAASGLHRPFTINKNLNRGVKKVSKLQNDLQNAKDALEKRGVVSMIKSLVVESNVVHRMAFCHHLWERSHALSLANNISEIKSHLQSVDIIVIAIEETHVSIKKLLSELSTLDIQVILASRFFTPMQIREIENANWFGVSLPIQKREFLEALDHVELAVLKKLEAQKHIEDVRKAFGGSKIPWERGRLLGKGAFGKVFEAKSAVTGGTMAVKCIERLEGGSAQEEAIYGEVKMMSELSHPNIIHYFYSELTESELLIFMELASEGSLESKIPPGGMDESTVAEYMEGILKGLQYLHSKDIAHRDIKTGNVLISNGTPKLTDFGTATKIKEKQTLNEEADNTAGTPSYMAPEVWNGIDSGNLADIWALGCLLMEASTKQLPFFHRGGTMVSVMTYIPLLKPTDTVDIGHNENNYGPAVLDFIRQCLVVDMTARPTCEELLQSRLLGECDQIMNRKATVAKLSLISRGESMRGSYSRRRIPIKTAQPVVSEPPDWDCSEASSPATTPRNNKICTPPQTRSRAHTTISRGSTTSHISCEPVDLSSTHAFKSFVTTRPPAPRKSDLYSPSLLNRQIPHAQSFIHLRHPIS